MKEELEEHEAEFHGQGAHVPGEFRYEVLLQVSILMTPLLLVQVSVYGPQGLHVVPPESAYPSIQPVTVVWPIVEFHTQVVVGSGHAVQFDASSLTK